MADDAQTQPPFIHIDLEHLGPDQRVDLIKFLDFFLGNVLIDLRDVNESFNAFHHLDEDAEIGDVDDPADDLVIDIDFVFQVFPGILGQLFDAKGKTFLVRVDVKDFNLDLIPLLGESGGFALPLAPGKIGNMHQSVDSLVQSDKDSKIRDVPHLPGDQAPDGVLEMDGFPRIGLGFLDGKRNAFAVHVQVLDHGLHYIRQIEQLGRMPYFPGPGHFGDVDQSLHAGFQFDEGAVVGQADDLA